MKQLLALAGAALLVAAAIVVRGAVDDDGGGSDDGSDDGELVVACVRELRDACEAIGGVDDLRVEDPAATVAAAGEIDAWVTLDPWPAIADEQERREVFDGDPVPVAASDLALLVRTAALPDACDRDQPDWACVAQAPRTAAPALPRPSTALGTLLLGHAAAGWSAATRPGEPFARNEFELPEFQAWLGALDVAADPVADMLQLAPAGPVAAGTTAADVRTRVEPSPRAGGLEATPTAVVARVAVVVTGDAAERVAADGGLRDGLEALGWRLDPEAATTGLPAPGVLLALTQEIR